MNQSYTYTNLSKKIEFQDSEKKNILVQNGTYSLNEAVTILHASCKLAKRLNIPLLNNQMLENYNQPLLYKTTYLSEMTQEPIYFLRGWNIFESCIKGFNAIGLLGYQAMLTHNQIRNLSKSEIHTLKKTFLLSRKDFLGTAPLFTKKQLSSFSEADLEKINLYDVAIWKSFSKNPIFVSTSGNMGISTHQALRLMQNTKISFKNKSFSLLNSDEGELIIWAPDDRADFMSKEKSYFLKQIEKEKPNLTKIQSYMNRQERDPGALSDALEKGGCFFPTNPQSESEIQNLLFLAFQKLEKRCHTPFAELIHDSKIQQTLTSLNCSVKNNKIYINKGVEAGIYGLMTPYFIMLEILFADKSIQSSSTWNQASIGAALAGAIYADHILRSWKNLSTKSQTLISEYFPNISNFLKNKKIGTNFKTSVEGVFDIANLQSLAQLLGVVITDHKSGRNTAFVGLGSSSYSNGNRCYDILKESEQLGESFKGKQTFHPVTHTITFFAQAIIYGEDLMQYIDKNPVSKITDKYVGSVLNAVKKPEPAGAASVAGYLLKRLDTGTLSIVEIAYFLKKFGFTKDLFLEFSSHSSNTNGEDAFIQKAFEEGAHMGNMAKHILQLLNLSHHELKKLWEIEKNEGQKKAIAHQNRPDAISLYITGNNGFQPSITLVSQLINNIQKVQTE